MAYTRTSRSSRRQRYHRKYAPSRTLMRNQGIYKPRQTIAQAGVGGAKLSMKAGFQQPTEVKSYYTSFTSAPATGNWAVITPSTLVSGIVQGTGGNNRIGRNIRMVGISIRISANTGLGLGTTEDYIGQPYTVDVVLDKRPNGVQATVDQIYALATDRTTLPNANFVDRFTWLRRVEMQSQNARFSTINITRKLNHVVNFEGTPNTGTITDLETNNILICSSGVDTTPNFTGTVCIMYVDA